MWLLLATLARAAELDRRFDTVRATVGGRAVELYVADTNERRARGLMFVEGLPKDRGMLFVFPEAQRLNFWMKNTLIPLAIGFFDDDCRLREIVEMKVATSTLDRPPTYESARPMRFALEMSAGWFGSITKPGAPLKLATGASAKGPLARCR